NPQGAFIRVDSCAYPNSVVPIHYDPMVAKLVAWGHSRKEAIRRLRRALDEYSLTGIKTNIVLHQSILEEPKFLDGSYTTQFLENDFTGYKDLFRVVDDRVFLISAAIEAYNDRKAHGIWDLNLTSQWKIQARHDSMRG